MSKKQTFNEMRLKLKMDLFTREAPETPKIRKQSTPRLECDRQLSLTCLDQEEVKAEIKEQAFKDIYQVGKQLGEGAHGEVRQCWLISNPDDTFAVKITRSSDPEIMDIMKQTFINTLHLKHVGVAKTYRLYIDPNAEQAYLVMEYLPYPSLEKIIKETTVEPAIVSVIIRQLLQAVAYIHQMGICHRDIKPDNVIFDTDSQNIKLIDFGVSKRFIQQIDKYNQGINLMWTVTGNKYYQAPELWHGCGYSSSIDTWSVGVIMYQLLLRKLPLSQQQFREDHQERFKDEDYLKLPDQPKDLLRRMLEWDPEKRLSANGIINVKQDLLRHPWLYVAKKGTTHDDMELNKKIKQGTIVRSVQAAIKQIQQSSFKMIENSVYRTKSKRIRDFKHNNADPIHLMEKLPSQQIRETQIHFQSVITSSSSINDDLFGIKKCDSDSDLPALSTINEEMETPLLQFNIIQ